MTNTKCKNDKNWENWERIREQKLEKMKSICFDSYRQSKRDKYFQSKPKPKCLDPSWYTDNIYSNRSMDEDDVEDYVPECVKYGTWKRRLRNIREQDEQYFDGEGESRQHSPSLHRASSYHEFNFNYPKSKSCCFGTKSSSSAKTNVPKSYSFSATQKTKPFDVIDYEPPPPTKRDRKMMRSMMMDNYFHTSRPIRYSTRDRFSGFKCYSDDIHHHKRRANRGGSRSWRYQSPPQVSIPCDEYCYRRQQIKRRPCSFDEDFYNCSYDPFETDLDHFIRDERERLMSQDKFLDEDERYLQQTHHYRPVRNKSMLEVRTPNKYDEDDYDSCSESTEIDLQDFNFDLEKYWEELEKPPSPIDLDMQERNMNKNLKVKNVNVGIDCYNNGRPIALHDREHERMMIKKSLLEGMPSPPQEEDDENHFGVFASAPSPFHRSHKIYPETIPNYKYNNFYSPDECDGSCSNNAQPQPHSGNSALSLINNIFSIYKPNKYSPVNCQLNNETKPDPCKKMNVPSTTRPLGCGPHPTHTSEFMPSMKRPLIISSEHPHFKIIPEKTGLKISPLYRFEFGDKSKHKLTSTARPLLFPH
ncbi:STAC3.2 family protein [Megaselia abdita]